MTPSEHPSPAVTAPDDDAAVLGRLSTLDRFLPVWILLAMAGGLLLGRVLPGIQDVLDAVKVGQTSLPIALGLLMMMYPVLAKVHYEDMSHVTGDKPMLWTLAAAQLGDRPGPDVHPRLGVPGRLPGVPHRADRHRPGPVHRHGADLERPGLRRPGGRRAARGDQLGVPGPGLRPAGHVLPRDPARLAGPAHRGRHVLHRGDHQVGADLPGHPPGRRVPHPPHACDPARARTGTTTGSCPGSARGRCTGCCSPSSSCSPCRARPSRPTR